MAKNATWQSSLQFLFVKALGERMMQPRRPDDRDVMVVCRGCDARVSAKRAPNGYTKMHCPECGAIHSGPAICFRDAGDAVADALTRG